MSTGTENYFSPAILFALGLAAGAILALVTPLSAGVPAVAGIVLAAGIAVTWRGPDRYRRFALLTAVFAAGLVAGQMRTEARIDGAEAIPAIDTRDNAVPLTGWLGAIERSGSGRQRLVIRVPAIDERPAYSVRVLGDPGDLRPGDPVSVEAVLSPPRPAAMPGGYDFAFHAFFARIAATGYAVAPAQPAPDLAADGVQRWIAQLRWRMAERIARQVPGRSGALAAALLTGDRSRLDPADVDALRSAGLGHMLAISGMHMGLFAGGVFFAVRMMAAGLGGWSRRHDPAVPAALAALIAAALYLAVSGGAIPTQRAFIMTVSALGAVLARRRVLSFHTLAIAMTAVLLLTPEAVVTPGFQMSFAAVAALIAAAQVWQAKRPPPAPLDPGRGLRQFFGGLGMTSLVAGVATSGFAAFHFHRIAAWGLIGNLIVMPVFTLLVMPAGVLALFLMPLGLDAVPLAVMGWGLDLVLTLAHMVADWPGAERAIPSAPGWVLALYGCGFAIACAARGLWRAPGIGVMLVAMAIWATGPRPDLFVTRDGVVLAQGEDAAGWAISDRRRSRFPVRVFLEAEGERERPDRLVLACDDTGCAGRTPGGTVFTLLEELDSLAEDCRLAGLIVTRLSIPEHRIRTCAARVIDGGVLARQGGALIREAASGELVIRHVLPRDTRLPWHARRTTGPEHVRWN
ncbi:ComEC/Rec2 family competence protein [Maricaulis sp.]|uniref:ComEC/Rec2 family competence protein n=1 Tax=Maricaulis sp. TaxID=1486257 RepID=UPI001B20F1BB|nr:ComEC/Rec2 family competence protein [Maricaulis sp.]MBO6764945.1 ComEC/Rec2 family competence protein [Maricaulis sp.]